MVDPTLARFATESCPVSTSTATILVVDDQEDNRDLLARRLSRRGFRVKSASSGEEALAYIDSESIDLVVLDVMMPGISGLDVLDRLRANPKTEELPVLMATARSSSEDIVDALQRGANDYITKPIDFPVLLARLATLLRSRANASKAHGLPGLPPPFDPKKPGVALASFWGRRRCGSRAAPWPSGRGPPSASEGFAQGLPASSERSAAAALKS